MSTNLIRAKMSVLSLDGCRACQASLVTGHNGIVTNTLGEADVSMWV